MSANNGGPAFPTKVSICRDTGAVMPHQFGNNEFCATGMTLRDYFAAKVMLGMISADRAHPHFDKDSLSRTAYQMADAMLVAREAK